MKLAFYRGAGDVVTSIIRCVTAGPYSHVEMVFSDGACFGASGRDPQGVRFWRRPLPAAEWDFVDLNLSREEEERARAAASRYAGRDFDFAGLWCFVVPFVPRSKDKQSHYCSEIVVAVLNEACGLFRGAPLRISPNELFRLVTQPLAQREAA